VPDAVAADVAEPAGGAAPLAFSGAGAQAQAGVAGVVRAAVVAFSELAGGRCEASIAQADGLARAARAGVQAGEPAVVLAVRSVAGLVGDVHAHGGRAEAGIKVQQSAGGWVEAADRDGERTIGGLDGHRDAGDGHGLLFRHGAVPSCWRWPGVVPSPETGLGGGSGWVPYSSARTSCRLPRTGIQPTLATASATSPITATSPLDSDRSSRS
jgi:hypothetical protein